MAASRRARLRSPRSSSVLAPFARSETKHGAVLASDERLERLCIEAGAHSTSPHRRLSADQPDLSCGTEGGGGVGSLSSPCVVVVFVGAGLQSGEHMFPMVWLPEVSE